MSEFAIGQRWLSNTQPELGLGAVVNIDFRSIEIYYPAIEESRIYTKNDAPLTRLSFSEGDTVKSQHGWSLSISRVEENQGVLIYHGYREDTKAQTQLAETMLDHHIRLNQPEQRLFNFQLDAPKWFDLRRQALTLQHDYFRSPCIGLAGARIELITHQLHIANEVGNRHAPRVLLADEVGLGKTIEAALIIHQQIKTGRCKRILIAVPDTLVHQWLVEMLRRVNLAFSIFDEDRCTITDEDGTNPFESEQLILCSIDFLAHNPKRQQQVLSAGWDMLVVDEAHHLVWSQEAPSQQYLVVEQLAAQIPSVLLLTATPDQLGHESHFARLRLLDPARFHDYHQFLEQENHYGQLADAVAPLLSDVTPSTHELQRLQALAPEILAHHGDLATADERQALLHQLIDCHGTGRLLFRNRRANISGFPQRCLNLHELSAPSLYHAALSSDDVTQALFPERTATLVESWTEHDPRVAWLLDFLPSVKPNKVLLICASAVTAQQLSEVIRTKTGIRQSVFHEGMSIVERDKAAHYFAQVEDGAQILLCSEIGSEGRNFQFAHHLVLFDLPLTPDLLEQRIGRLDRIGQTKDIQIHVPVMRNTPQAVLARWYDEGLDAFSETNPIGSNVFSHVKGQLLDALTHADNHPQIDELVKESAQLSRHFKDQLEQGRDRLIELNASGEGRVESLIEAIIALDNDKSLPQFMDRLFDAIGVHTEEKGNDCFILTPTESMIGQLPGLLPEGMTVTYRRRIATTLEHVHFISWDHPLVHNAIDMVLMDVLGKSSIGFIADPALPKGTYWLEALYVLSVQAPRELQAHRFLPQTPIRICMNAQGQPQDIEFGDVRRTGMKTAQQLITALQPMLPAQIEKAGKLAHTKANQVLHDAITHMQQTLGEDCQRLRDLQVHNPAIREEEIVHIEKQMTQLASVLQNADVQLDGLRVVVNNP